MNVFVTAINTDSGKTLVSAILCRALQADYWKPVQAGTPSDSETLRTLISPDTIIHREAYALKTPESPHAAALKDGIRIELDEINLPATKNNLVIEGAGGCLVPLNETHFVIDIAAKLACPVVVVSNIYLGSINHTLLTIEALQKRAIQIEGIIFNGPANADTESIILKHSGVPCLLRIPKLERIDKDVVNHFAGQFNANRKELSAN